ncbi:hypothetical protein CkaCkLH20_09764 [Colletotrichum karsti]|uniref:Carrier domain-containing protein n=1 Tax=Colletotrichum karsti TaxID=1095194 RepID=A0A9P6I2P3_9PEZI|nr:uncharacterized protein CkaCkLH20_09764 [Colletotrichum karsti]KAF9872901.1 hypothetical protein CkaCkLH20_09764 [Colletotrichum karsti]
MGSIAEEPDRMQLLTADTTANDIAVVGMSFKLPQGVDDVASFWDVLQNRRNLSTPWPESRMNAEAFVSGKRSKFNCQGGHFINDDPASFDAPFFSISTKEAAALDPMQRWTLETSYRALENAGIPAEKLKGSRTGVFSASFTDDWSRMLSQDPENVERTAATGMASSLIANRVSWYFDLRGPSVHIDTACSSSLVALDMACQSLRAGESSSALVTGSSLMLTPTLTHWLSNLGFLSPDGKCWTFDSRANGYARGEGFVALVLKPLPAALRDGDMIRSVIRATGTNQDGQTPSLTQPNPKAQEELIRHVYKKANLAFDKTRYVEAHGTGTPVGDPIEVKAIGNVFRSSRSAEEPLYVGSVKTNIGHLEGSSGLAGVVKSIISLEKGVIPPHANFEEINPDIDTEFYNVAIPIKEIVWPSQGLRRISVCSFGFGGTNTHVVLDDAYHYLHERGLVGNHCTTAPTGALLNGLSITNGTTSNGNGSNGHVEGHINGHVNGDINGHNKLQNFDDVAAQPRLLVWSAADEKAVKRTTEQYKSFYENNISNDPARLDRLAYTLSNRRSRMLWRTSAIVTTDSSDAASFIASKPVRSSGEVGLAFVFTGQGAQYAGMGWELVQQYPLFAETLKRVNKIYGTLGCDWELLDELRHGENIDRPGYSQPLSTAVQLALIELLKSFGIVPKAVIGHSSGEIAAAYAIGALSLESACKVSFYRGQLAGRLRVASSPAGAMISVNLAENDVPTYLDNLGIAGVSVACVNSPLNCTLSGPEDAIDAVKKQADIDSIFAQKLKTGVAYHSSAMLAIADDYKQQMGELEASAPRSSIVMVSTVTGKSVRSAVLATPQYWVDNMVSPVRFSDAVHALTQQSSTLKSGFLGSITDLVEIGPTAALRRPVADTLAQAGSRAKQVRYSSVLFRKRSAVDTTLELVGQLFSYGYQVQITAVNQVKGNTSFLVDCPEYPFDHSKKYWSESRISRDYRLRGAVIGETLGTRVSDWNPLEPRWRNFLSVETEPWVADHNVSNTVVYPAAGMLVMAMEAALQMVPVNRTVSGYSIKEANFMSPIIVGEAWEDRTETVVELRPIQKPYEKDSTWSDIRVFCYRNKEWSECFRGRIQVQYEEDSSQADVQKEKTLLDQDILKRYKNAAGLCMKPVDSNVFYRHAADHGLRYGDWCRLLEDIHWDGRHTAVARINVSKPHFNTSSLVHPAVLDAVFHMPRASSQASASASATNVPVKIVNAWVSASGWQSPDTGSLRCSGVANVDHDAGEDATIYTLSDNGKVLMSIEHLVTKAISKVDESSAPPRQLLHNAEWKPQLSLLDQQQLSQACITSRVVKDDATALTHHLEMCAVMNLALSRTLRDMSAADFDKVPASLQRHVAWIRHHLDSLDATQKDDPEAPLTDEELEQRLQSIEAMRPPWKLHTNVVRELKNILIGEKDPLEVIFDSDLADVFYADLFSQVCDVRLSNFLELASHENPGLRILEVGAGTGGFTGHVLGALQSLEREKGGLRLAEYTYTDISPMFFDRARERWKALEGRINFKTLDLERTLESQGFEVGSYDLIVAGSVLHATADLVGTMKNVRTALKPGGRALILEVIAPEDVVVNFSFGLVPGWWLAREEWRKMSPLLNEEQWNGCLRESGYSGNDLVLRDHVEDGCHICSVIVSTAVQDAPTSAIVKPLKVLVVVDGQSETQREVADLVSSHTNGLGLGHSVSILSIDEFQQSKPDPEDVVLCLASVDTPFLFDMSESRLAWLQHLIRHSKKLMWVTETNAEDSQRPFYSQAQGFFRSLRLEMADSHIVTLAIESQGDSAPSIASQHISKVFRNCFLSSEASSELEFTARNGLLETCRATEDVKGNAAIDALLFPKLQQKPWSEGPALSLSIKTVGTLDSLCFIEDTTFETDLAAEEVEIEAKAWGVNFRDVLQALGRLDERDFGNDCAGVVTRTGSACRGSFEIGDRVCMVSPGCMRRYPRAPATSVIKIPRETMSFVAGAAVLIPGMTAYHALVNVARIAQGETILIHSAAGSTGQMAVSVAQKRGAVVYATVGSEKKKRFLVDEMGVPEENIFHSRNTSFAQGVMRVTNGRGVDVVLNSLSGDSLRASWGCMARRGRFVEIGKADIMADAGLPMSSFSRNVSFSAVDLREIMQEDPRLTAELLRDTMGFACENDASPSPVKSYPASQVEQAFRALQNGSNIGRVVIEPSADDVVPQYLTDRKTWKFDANASYLVAGGFGGVGRAILTWMADRGAKHLIVPSRSGASSKAATETIESLRSRGVAILSPKCDVASESALSVVLADCSTTMPPIKGCIDAALVLQDAMFENMTLPQWDIAVKAKIDTAWNLHRLLPKDLDFFVLLSSLAGIIGQMATANYAGGCTFQDALARHRVETGQKAVSLDIGWMRDVGIVAETAAFQRQRLATDDMQQIDARELLALLTLCCDHDAPVASPGRSQVLVGLRTPADFLAKGESPPALLERPFFGGFSRVAGTQAGAKVEATDPAALFRAAASPEEKLQVVVDSLVAKLARAMSIAPADVELSKPLSSYGVDSLMAVELRNWIRRDFAAPLAVFDIMGGTPISAVGELVVSRSTSGDLVKKPTICSLDIASMYASHLAVAVSTVIAASRPVQAGFQVLSNTPSGAFTYTFGNSTYYTPAAPVNTANSTLDTTQVLPLTVFETNETSITSDVLSALAALYISTDDVWSTEFLEGAVVVSTPENAVLDPSAIAWLERSNVAYFITGDGHNFTSLKSSQLRSLTIPSVDELPPGPYTLSINPSATAIHETYRLYRDAQEAFLFGVTPVPGSAAFSPVEVFIAANQDAWIPVPSRLYSLGDDRPLAGIRVALKDIYDLEGVQTSGGSRSYAEVFPPANMTSVPTQKLIDMGAVIVGKTKTSQFAHGADPWFWQDHHYPWNPRGDGYLSASSSSSGSAAAIAAYPWLDLAVGSDTRGSVRRPSAYVGSYGMRPSWGSMDLTGVIPLADALDTAGVFARDPVLFREVNSLWYEGSQVAVNGSFTGMPRKLIYPVDYFPLGNPDAQALFEGFMDVLEEEFGMVRTPMNITATLHASGSNTQITNVMAFQLGSNRLAEYVSYNKVGVPLEEAWDARFPGVGRPPLDPNPRAAFQRSVGLSEADYEAALATKREFQDFFLSEVLRPDPHTCSESLMILDAGTGGLPSYREQALSARDGAYSDSYTGVGGGSAVPGTYLASMASCPEIGIPVGQVAYESFVSLRTEMVPVSVDLVAARGCDGLLLEVLRRLAVKGVVKTVKTGRTAF